MAENNELDIINCRREYIANKLCYKDLPANPLALFNSWLKQALQAGLTDATAMCVATVDETGQPFQRTVLLKSYDNNGMVFYTNLNSRKALHLAKNAAISLLFPWHSLDRQVIILGHALLLSTTEAAEYFQIRPRNSQIAAWISQQSATIVDRHRLDQAFIAAEQRFHNKNIPVPNTWGGFRVCIKSVEFWQGRENRLHDRFIYQREEANLWTIARLAP